MASRKPGAMLRAGKLTGTALWRQVADDLERAIASGTYGVGARLPGENEIADFVGVNRHIVRRALAALSERGLVRGERGSGTYVKAQRIPYPIRSRTRFSEIVGAAGREAGGRLVAHASEPANADLAARLDLAPGAAVIRMEIVRSADRAPVCTATTWLPASLLPDAARVFRASQSMTKILAHFGIREYRRRETRISATVADAVDAGRLKLAVGSPLVIVDSIDETIAGRSVLTTRLRFAADRVELVVETEC